MGRAALLLAVLGLCLGLWPLGPHGAVSIVVAVIGILPSLLALILAWKNRARALSDGTPLALPTTALGLSVGATLLTSSWLFALIFFSQRPR